jgi:hypothetical protein
MSSAKARRRPPSLAGPESAMVAGDVTVLQKEFLATDERPMHTDVNAKFFYTFIDLASIAEFSS